MKKIVSKRKLRKLLMSRGVPRNDAKAIADEAMPLESRKFLRSDAEWIADLWHRRGLRWMLEAV